ncbi:hypothetical protein D9757_011907 [Collybiopsis confluens]|uniref:Nephrocystin 3-like N-terminal domain-containing protein n=1 Tax=Collybiopsis confluens TaxID=2823264 RepID=A0A8H5GG42_9AGAR|nr:hypothetical protein D9757_011907 [Collybiopsis confluens]
MVAGRDVNIYEEGGEKGLSILYRNTSTSASYDAVARYPPPLCHPGTREAVLNDLESWASSKNGYKPVLWLHGPAGAGKSAIAQTFAQTCAANGSLIGSFFFWRSDPSRNNPNQLFTTLALQIAIAIPELRPMMEAAVSHDPLAPTSSIERQCDALIIQPFSRAETFRKLRNRNSTSSNELPLNAESGILIIDGLDECADSHNQQLILSILAKMVSKYKLPIRILICSRPEPRIKESFRSLEFDQKNCLWMSLDDTYQASKDIRRFLEDEFQKILQRHPRSMAHVPLPWPTSAQIEILVQKSSGQFIYPSTVLKYIDDDRDVPADRLNVIIHLEPRAGTEESPYRELDALYHQILTNVKKETIFRQVLAAYLTFYKGSTGFEISEFLDLLDIPVGTIHAVFSGVHSLFQEPSPLESGFQFAHASFPDFLGDPSRSLHFHITTPFGHDYLAQLCLEKWRLPYSLRHWAFHCAGGGASATLLSKLDSFSIYIALTRKLARDSRKGRPWMSGLSSLLIWIYHFWSRFQDQFSHDPKLRELRDFITHGFTLVLQDHEETEHEKTERRRFFIHIRYPKSWYLLASDPAQNMQDLILAMNVHLMKRHYRMYPVPIERIERRPLRFTEAYHITQTFARAPS